MCSAKTHICLWNLLLQERLASIEHDGSRTVEMAVHSQRPSASLCVWQRKRNDSVGLRDCAGPLGDMLAAVKWRCTYSGRLPQTGFCLYAENSMIAAAFKGTTKFAALSAVGDLFDEQHGDGQVSASDFRQPRRDLSATASAGGRDCTLADFPPPLSRRVVRLLLAAHEGKSPVVW